MFEYRFEIDDIRENIFLKKLCREHEILIKITDDRKNMEWYIEKIYDNPYGIYHEQKSVCGLSWIQYV